MKTNDLRIGNLVLNEDGGVCKLFNIHEGYINHKPIPLTEEWLLKFGFTPDERKIVYDHPLPKEPENEHKDLGTKYPAFFMNNRLNRWMDCHTRVCIDYVHQLQNLYFALTGEELEVKQWVSI